MDNHNLCHNNDYLQTPQNELKPSLLKKHCFFSLIQFGDENVQKRTMQCLIRKYSLCGIDTHTGTRVAHTHHKKYKSNRLRFRV